MLRPRNLNRDIPYPANVETATEITVEEDTTINEFFKYCKNGWVDHKLLKLNRVGSEGMTSIGVSQIASSLLSEVEIIQRIGMIIKQVIINKIEYDAMRVTI